MIISGLRAVDYVVNLSRYFSILRKEWQPTHGKIEIFRAAENNGFSLAYRAYIKMSSSFLAGIGTPMYRTYMRKVGIQASNPVQHFNEPQKKARPSLS
jgi:hypothetical protein